MHGGHFFDVRVVVVIYAIVKIDLIIEKTTRKSIGKQTAVNVIIAKCESIYLKLS